MSQRATAAVWRMLVSAGGWRFDDPATVARIWSGCLIGPVQGLLESSPHQEDVAKVRDHLKRLSVRYLAGEAKPIIAGAELKPKPGGLEAPAPPSRPGRPLSSRQRA